MDYLEYKGYKGSVEYSKEILKMGSTAISKVVK